jgi:hypothetical protein
MSNVFNVTNFTFTFLIVRDNKNYLIKTDL